MAFWMPIRGIGRCVMQKAMQQRWLEVDSFGGTIFILEDFGLSKSADPLLNRGTTQSSVFIQDR